MTSTSRTPLQTEPPLVGVNEGRQIMADVPTGWQPDPFGIHEHRFFSDDGKPTRLVSDRGEKSHDLPPAFMTSPPVHHEPSAPAVPDELVAQAPAPREAPTIHHQQQSEAPTLTGTAPLSESGLRIGSQHPPLEPAAASAPVRARFLCRQCGGRHDRDDGICPRCGVVSIGATPTPAQVPAPPPTYESVTSPITQRHLVAAPEAGWYPDPGNPAQLRYWSGNSWTEHITSQVPTR